MLAAGRSETEIEKMIAGIFDIWSLEVLANNFPVKYIIYKSRLTKNDLNIQNNFHLLANKKWEPSSFF